jgi:N-acyl-D-amino-acid deacylase
VSAFVIRGGDVLDGTGAEASRADVLIEDGRIQAIGRIGRSDLPTVDASGLSVAPGFIDIHSHSDYTLLVDPRAVSAVTQGVTTEVVGNCGFGCFPIDDPDLAATAVYGYDGTVPLAWRDAAGYFAALRAAQPAVNVASLTPHGQLRLSTMGLSEHAAQPAELTRMARLLEASLAQGTWGLSTGLEYAWEAGASEEDVTALCGVVARAGALYATHTRDRDAFAADAVAEAIRVADGAGVRLQISHLTPRSGFAENERCLALVEHAQADGLDVQFDMHTRLYGITYLHAALPPWALERPAPELRALLLDRSAREAIRSHRSLLSAGGDWSRVVLLDNPVWQQYARRDLHDIAGERGQTEIEALCDLLAGAASDTRQLMVIIHCYDEHEQRRTFGHPLCVPGSDATTLAPDGPLARSFFHGAYSWAAWFYRFAVREHGILSAPQGVHRMTGQPARRLGLVDRGVIRVGAAADAVVFDPESFADRATTFEPNQPAVGMVHVIVNGVLTMIDGALTGERGGVVLRRA